MAGPSAPPVGIPTSGNTPGPRTMGLLQRKRPTTTRDHPGLTNGAQATHARGDKAPSPGPFPSPVGP
eukprot:5851155-Karenia_brevis.AAC.1